MASYPILRVSLLFLFITSLFTALPNLQAAWKISSSKMESSMCVVREISSYQLQDCNCGWFCRTSGHCVSAFGQKRTSLAKKSGLSSVDGIITNTAVWSKEVKLNLKNSFGGKSGLQSQLLQMTSVPSTNPILSSSISANWYTNYLGDYLDTNPSIYNRGTKKMKKKKESKMKERAFIIVTTIETFIACFALQTSFSPN